MAAPKRNNTERERDLVKIAELYCHGKSQVVIAEELGVCQQQVSYDIRILIRRWQDNAEKFITERKGVELEKLNELERTYWTAWERSQMPKEKKAKDGTAYTVVPDGNPAFLQGVERCIATRCKIGGFLKEEKGNQQEVNVSVAQQGTIGLTSFSPELQAKMLCELQAQEPKVLEYDGGEDGDVS